MATALTLKVFVFLTAAIGESYGRRTICRLPFVRLHTN
jgi:hypothetical protein